MAARKHDIFITDADYDLDESDLGITVASTAGSLTDTLTTSGAHGLALRDIVRLGNSGTASSDLLIVLEIVSPTSIRVSEQISSSAALPLYKVREWLPKPVKLLSAIRHISRVDLMGIQIVSMAHANLTTGHEIVHDDYYILRIAEIPGSVLSTNRVAHGAFAIVPTHNVGAYHPTNYLDATDCVHYFPEGFTSYDFSDAPLAHWQQLTPKLLDRKGEPVQLGRFHIWLRVWGVC